MTEYLDAMLWAWYDNPLVMLIDVVWYQILCWWRVIDQ